jgi:hypothetical protein
MTGPEPCPRCGLTPAPGSPDGLCPRCMLGGVLGNGSATPTTGGVLETLALTNGPLPRVLLRDTDDFSGPGPIVRPSSPEMPDRAGRLQLFGEIARGGMGAVLKGRDNDLGRDVAIKVLREDLRDDGDLVRRFVEEAQIAGQLQHPGVVPIYELGTFNDKRPFFCMKLVKGQTLADLLANRPTPSDDLPRFLAIFEAMAQIMAYAHTRGVIHRDLKPSNVMVGSFGEVQVMDWGLAKVLARGGVVADAKAGKEKPPETMIATARSGSDLELSHAGSVMGTPSYMPPEQARGETELIDERADVFALGSILAEILTGSPAFTGRNSGEIVRKSAKGDTADALKRLDACGAEADLIALAKDCLEVEPEDRPHDAKAVADRITSYLAGVQERVQIAERDRAVAIAKVVEERKRRKVQLALAASVLAITTMGGLGVLYEQRQRSVRAATVAKVIGEASTFRNLARANPEDVARWQTALAAVKQAEGVAGADAEALGQLAALRVEVQAGADAADRDRILLDKLVDIRSARADDPDGSATDAAYADAFQDAGLDLSVLPTAEAGAKIVARPLGVALALAAALDDWSADWPRSPDWPTPTPGATTSAPRWPWRPRRVANRRCRPWPGPPSSTNWGPSASTCWAMPWMARETWRRPSGCCVGRRSATRETSGSTTTWRGCWSGSTAATTRSGSTPLPAPSVPRPGTNWPMRWPKRANTTRRSRSSVTWPGSGPGMADTWPAWGGG